MTTATHGKSRGYSVFRNLEQSPETACLRSGRCRVRTCGPLRVKQPRPNPLTTTSARFRPLLAGLYGLRTMRLQTKRLGLAEARNRAAREIQGMNA